MNVRQVIEELSKLDPEMVVVREFDFEGPYVEVEHVDVVDRLESKHKNDIDGEEQNFYYRGEMSICYEGKIVPTVKLW